MNIFIIIPAYNEEKTISDVVESLCQKYENVIVVDDGSSDATGLRAREAGVLVLRHIVNRGQGAALQTGIDYALMHDAECVVTFDADGQHCVDDIPALIAPIARKEADVVLGSRFLNERGESKKSIPFFRALTIKLALLHQWFFTGLPVTDSHCGVRAFSRFAAKRITITQDRMSHASEILDAVARLQVTYVEVPVHVTYTAYSLMKGQKGLKGSIRIVYDFFIGRFVS